MEEKPSYLRSIRIARRSCVDTHNDSALGVVCLSRSYRIATVQPWPGSPEYQSDLIDVGWISRMQGLIPLSVLEIKCD